MVSRLRFVQHQEQARPRAKLCTFAIISSIEIEVRKRTFWAVYSLGIEMSSTLGLAPMLRCADCGEWQRSCIAIASGP